MPRVVERLSRWTRETAASIVSELRSANSPKPVACAHDDLIYRLRQWPKMPGAGVSIDVRRILGVMSTRPVNRRWILNNSKMQAREVDLLLRRLTEQGAVEITDAGKYRPAADAA